MMRAVRFDQYGDESVLDIREVEDPVATPGRVLVRVKAAAINPGEIFIRNGSLDGVFPTTFPSGEGGDLAGEVVATGEGVSNFAPGDSVLGWTEERASHAELVTVPAEQLVHKPQGMSWETAGSMKVAPMAALASVRAVNPVAGETVAVSAAAGGVGSVAVQLAGRNGATVIGLASETNHEWLRSHNVIPVSYSGDDLADRLREAANGHLDAFIDTFGSGYVDLALELGVAPGRINTIADFGAAREHGVQAQGSTSVASTSALQELTDLVASGELEIPVARTYPLEDVREAYRDLAERRTHGKIVLLPQSDG